MEARKLCAALVAVLPVLLGASYRTQNFIVTAPDAPTAKAVGDAAESYRNELAVEWLGEPLPAWSQPCPIQVQVGPKLGAGGATSFVFDRGEVFGWTMTIQGSYERLLDSVLPHEVTHTIFASHFRQPVPRWADEGACTTVEHASERTKQQQMLIQFLKTGRGIPFSSMFAMKEYPADVLPLYAQGHSLAGFFIGQGGKRKFLQFVAEGLQEENWTKAVQAHYGFSDLGHLQTVWLDWVRGGSKPIAQPAAGDQPIVTASATAAPAAAPNLPSTPLAVQVASAAPVPQQSAAPQFQWVSAAESAKKRQRPTPNLVHHQEEKDIVNAGALVPVQFSSGVNGAGSAAAAATAALPGPVDPFVAAHGPSGEAAAHSALSSGVQAGPVRAGASRPQAPQTPGQIVLEWTKTAEPPPIGYSSAPQALAPAMPQPPLLDASLGGGLRR